MHTIEEIDKEKLYTEFREPIKREKTHTEKLEEVEGLARIHHPLRKKYTPPDMSWQAAHILATPLEGGVKILKVDGEKEPLRFDTYSEAMAWMRESKKQWNQR